MPIESVVDERERRVFGQVIRRLIPFIFICYVIAYIDRVNIGFAARQMQRDLGMSDIDSCLIAVRQSSLATVLAAARP